MTDKTERMIAEAKMERVDELRDDIAELQAEVDRKIEELDRLLVEAEELINDE